MRISFIERVCAPFYQFRLHVAVASLSGDGSQLAGNFVTNDGNLTRTHSFDVTELCAGWLTPRGTVPIVHCSSASDTKIVISFGKNLRIEIH